MTASHNDNGETSKDEQFTCFLIDDDVDDQEIFMTVLEEVQPDIRCITAANGQEAIDKIRHQRLKPDLIFLDLNMPLMNGQQFLQACSAHDTCKEIPVIILTTSSDRRTIDETLQLGAKDYITKPDKFSEWGVVIREKINTWRNQRARRR